MAVQRRHRTIASNAPLLFHGSTSHSEGPVKSSRQLHARNPRQTRHQSPSRIHVPRGVDGQSYLDTIGCSIHEHYVAIWHRPPCVDVTILRLSSAP